MKSKTEIHKESECDFQTYIDSVKQKTIPWNLFENFVTDLSHSNSHRLKYLNTILLNELAHSDINRSKCMNSILMTEFQEFLEYEHLEVFQKHGVASANQLPEEKERKNNLEVAEILESENLEDFQNYALVPTNASALNHEKIKEMHEDYKCDACGKLFFHIIKLEKHTQTFPMRRNILLTERKKDNSFYIFHEIH